MKFCQLKHHGKSLTRITVLLAALSFSICTFANTTKPYEVLDHPNTSGLTPTVLKSAINGYEWAIKHHDVTNKNILTIVNFTVPSYKKRMWVLDLKTNKILMAMHVAQGKNSGSGPIYATRFSNVPGSLESSPGIFTTASEFNGDTGLSMRLNGLEPGINNNAMSREIVIHPAWYVKPSFIKEHGYTGRSWGCFAFNPNLTTSFLHNINHHSVLFAYAPSENHDPLVDHALSSKGEKIYHAVMADNSRKNPVESFFDSIGI